MLHRGVYRRSRANRCQLLRKQCRFLVSLQLGLERLACNVFYILQHRFHAAIFLNQLKRCLRPHAGNAGYIIRGIAHQAFQLNQLRRHQSLVISSKFCFVKHLDIRNAALGIKHLGALIHQLQLIAVAGDDNNLHVLRRMHGKGTDNIIGLIIIQLQRADAQCSQNLHCQRKLLAQLAWRRLALRLIFRIQLTAEGFA